MANKRFQRRRIKTVEKPDGEKRTEEEIEQWEEKNDSPRHWLSLMTVLSLAAKVLGLLS
ncbi:hypothetical protein QWY84_05510 [Aquisalimonas lutea]|uniref:hypothetical protein n=1 Tax=Aquisalimonas lutea TaxID=1327750 RepID=UPI0025B40124|nr:hypothetical protein [Aquisalimonas lutea]MDN3517061.1 hypothetical protein [Aquisalimonas lutea]